MWFLILFLSLPAFAQITDCVFNFATLAEAESPNETLIGGAYESLLDTLGGEKLSPAVLERLAAHEDPFTLPEAAGLDGLQRNLRRLEQLLEEKRWNLPTIRAQLIERVKVLRRKKERAGKKQGEVVERSWPDYEVMLNAGTDLVRTPEANVVLARTSDKSPGRWRLFDPNTRKIWDVEVPGTYEFGVSAPAFLPGGKELLFVASDNLLWRVPFVGGKPEWEKKIEIPLPDAAKIWTHPNFGRSPHFAYVSTREHTILRLDLRTNQFAQYPKKLLGTGVEVDQWGAVPGSDNLYLLVDERKGELSRRSVRVVKLGDKGELTPVSEGPSWDHGKGGTMIVPSYIKWSVDGQTGYASDFSNSFRVESFQLGQTTSVEIPASSQYSSPPEAHFVFHHLVLDPTGKLGAYFAYDAGDNEKSFVVVFDQKTQRALGTRRVRENTGGLIFTADGSHLLASDRRGNVTVINPEQF